MLQIKSMTKEQAARMPEWAAKWVEIGLSTAPADFDAATEAALKAYKLCNLEHPMIVLRMGSPMAATIGGIYAWEILRNLAKNGKVESQVRSQVWSQVWSQVRSQVESQVGSQVWSQVRSKVESQVCHQVGFQVESQVRSQVESQVVYNDRGGAFMAPWCAYVSFIRDVLGWSNPVLEKFFGIDEQLTRSCGWVWWHENVLSISDRPEVLNRDEQGRLHCENAPSIKYRDGWSLYNWHGVSVPEYVIEKPQEITIEKIHAEKNAEVQRVMIERYGEEKYIVDSGMQPVAKDDRFGDIYLKEVEAGKPIAKIRVVNRSPEPDGSFKIYWLNINPKHYGGDAGRIPQAAVASTWRTTEGGKELFFRRWQDYSPVLET